MKPELDSRLFRKKPSDITLDFVRENLTEEELEVEVVVEVLTSDVRSFYLKAYSLEEAIIQAEDYLAYLKGIDKLGLKSFSTDPEEGCSYEVETTLTKFVTQTLKGIDKLRHYQELWKQQIKDFTSASQEWHDYLKLKKKFEGADERLVDGKGEVCL